MADYEAIERGKKASRILNDSDFKYLLSCIERDVFKQFRTTNFNDSNKREDTHKLIYAMDMVVKRLERYVTDGQYALKNVSSPAEEILDIVDFYR